MSECLLREAGYWRQSNLGLILQVSCLHSGNVNDSGPRDWGL